MRLPAWLVLCCLVISFGSTARAQDRTDAAAAQLKETLDRLNALNEWFSESEAKRNRWLVEIKSSDAKVSSLSLAVGKVRNEILATQDELEQVSADNEALQVRRRAQAKLVGEHVAAAYRLSGQDFLKQLLNQESPDKFERMIKYHQIFSQSRLDLLDEYKGTLTELEQSNKALQTKESQLQAEQQTLEAEQENLEGQRAERNQLISQLDAQVETRQEEYRRLEADRARLETLLAELRRRASQLRDSNFQAAKGSLPMPVRGSIRHAFGSNRADGRMRWHGIDIRANLGEPVRAVFAGRVVFSDWLRGFGLLTIVDHGSNYLTLYGHADALLKSEGDVVESGETIATAGNSGGRNETGIYFEVRHKGETVDPILWVSR
ncbi:MAG: peptidoglycan DD-metalloendopeptidase family protein [Pseudomonadota bacterium]